MWNWTLSPYHCPVCHSPTHYRYDQSEGILYGREESCNGCGLFYSITSYGNTAERLGFVSNYWSWSVDTPDRSAEAAEAKTMYAHPDFAAMRNAEWYALADWLEELDCTLQAEAVRLSGAAADF